MTERRLLDDPFKKAVYAEAHQEQAERGDHRHQPEILRCKEPGQDDCGQHLDDQPRALRKHRKARTTNGSSPEAVAVTDGLEAAVFAEWLHLLTKVLLNRRN